MMAKGLRDKDILILSWITIAILYAIKDLWRSEYRWMLAFIPIGMSDLSDEIKLVIFSLMYLTIFAYRNFYKSNKPEDEDEVQKMHLTDEAGAVDIEIIIK